jgi:transglutaminase-like putative cysteine protease
MIAFSAIKATPEPSSIMRFKVNHLTRYAYGEPVSESIGELRLTPVNTPTQAVLAQTLSLTPPTPVLPFDDFFGNRVSAFSIPQRHESLTIEMTATVETQRGGDPGPAADIPFGEARRPHLRHELDRYIFRLPTAAVPLIEAGTLLPKRFFRDSMPLRSALLSLNGWIHAAFSYRPGSTQVSTPIQAVIRDRAGVCQDFAHLMLSLLRAQGLICRYVSGYIEPHDPDLENPGLIGAHASHAWIEVLLQDGNWWGLDPTNDQTAGERHIRLAVGRDYHDVAPLRGTFKGPHQQTLTVEVSVERIKGDSLA